MPDHGTLEPPLAATTVDRLQLQPKQVVADFGVGGHADWAVRMAKQVGNEGQVLMFDVRKGALAAALNMAKLQGLGNCRGVWSNLEIFRGALGVSDEVFDAGIIINMLNETRHPKDVLAEVHRMVKNQGQLMIIDWDPDTTHPLAPKPERRLAGDFLTSLAQEVGFSLLDSFQPSPNYWGRMYLRS